MEAPAGGRCEDLTVPAATQSEKADSTVINILRYALNTPEKGTADAHYLRPTVVFENVCVCNGTFGEVHVDRNECVWVDWK